MRASLIKFLTVEFIVKMPVKEQPKNFQTRNKSSPQILRP